MSERYAYRRAREADVRGLVALAEEMHAETEFRTLPFDPIKTGLLFLDRTRDPAAVVLVHTVDGVIEGLMAGRLAEPIFSPELVAFDDCWYVSPRRRGSLAGARLAALYLAWAKAHNAKAAFMTVASGGRHERVGQLATRIGFRPMGGVYRRDFQT